MTFPVKYSTHEKYCLLYLLNPGQELHWISIKEHAEIVFSGATLPTNSTSLTPLEKCSRALRAGLLPKFHCLKIATTGHSPKFVSLSILLHSQQFPKHFCRAKKLFSDGLWSLSEGVLMMQLWWLYLTHDSGAPSSCEAGNWGRECQWKDWPRKSVGWEFLFGRFRILIGLQLGNIASTDCIQFFKNYSISLVHICVWPRSCGGFEARNLLYWVLCFGRTILTGIKSHIVLCSLHNATWKECPGDTWVGPSRTEFRGSSGSAGQHLILRSADLQFTGPVKLLKLLAGTELQIKSDEEVYEGSVFISTSETSA